MMRKVLAMGIFTATAIVVFNNAGQALALFGLTLTRIEAGILLVNSLLFVSLNLLGRRTLHPTPKPL
ncbi:MAG TPA: hypothetical protein VLJ21_00880 [Candidatus Binatia bacterium]|nr:hypothetical protein [Candidatus Binatia bacterium]